MAVRRTDLASLIQSRVFVGFCCWGGWWSSCGGCGLPRSPPEVLSNTPSAEITPDLRIHAAEPMALENFRNRCVLWLSILPFPPFQSSSALFFPELWISVTSSFLVLFLLLFRNYMEGAEGGGRVVWGRERAREWGGGKRVAKKLCSFQPGALWKIWHPLLICSSKNPSGEGMLKEKKINSRTGQALKMWALKAVDPHRRFYFKWII